MREQDKNKVTDFSGQRKNRKKQADIVYLSKHPKAPVNKAEQAKTSERWVRILGGIAISLLFIASVVLLVRNSATDKQQAAMNLSEIQGSPLEVHFIDVGQGDAILAKCGEETLLIDAGDRDHADKVVEYLNSQGITRLNYVIGSHYDSDHIGGLKKVIQSFPCDTIILPDQERDTKTYQKLHEEIAEQGYEVNHPVAGQKYSLGDSASFMILGPQEHEYEKNNDYSIIVRLVRGRNSFLFTGDAEAVAEEELLSSGYELSSDVLKIAHHGSSSSSSEAFLKAVDPSIAVISVGEGNENGHPHRETIELLNKLGITIYRTDKKGTIVCVSDGRTVKVK